MTYAREFVTLVNDLHCTAEAFAAAEPCCPLIASSPDAPITASKDSARFLEHVPGCFAFLGNETDSLPLQNSGYDFADAILVDGARFFGEVVRRRPPPNRPSPGRGSLTSATRACRSDSFSPRNNPLNY